MLEMGCRFAVTGADGPAVSTVKPDGTTPHSNHGLDGNAHAGFQRDAVAAATVVRHLRVLMHLPTNTVTGKFADNSVALGLAVVLNGTADVTDMATSCRLGNAPVERLLRDTQQTLDIFSDLTDTERVAGVATETVEQCATVDGDDVTLAEDGLGVRNAMNHDIVHRGANAGGKRPSIGIGETLESGNCSIVTNKLVGNLIQLEGRYTRLNMFRQFAKGSTNKLVGPAHQHDFVFSLQKDLHAGLVGTHSTTVYTAGIEKTVIMAHQQVALYLLEGVKHHTDKNEQRRAAEEL